MGCTLSNSTERERKKEFIPISIYVYQHICINISVYKQEGAISTVNGKHLMLIDKFLCLGSNISSTESDVKIYQSKTRSALYRLSIIWKSDLFSKTKRCFF